MISTVARNRRRVLETDLRGRVFHASGLERVGLEVEFIPVDARTRRRVPIVGGKGAGTGALLLEMADRLGWHRLDTRPPSFDTPGGRLSFEPGGQIELSSPPHVSVGALLAGLHSVLDPLLEAAEARGIDMLAVGADPQGSIEDAPLLRRDDRYRRMAAYLAGIAPHGARMMRQTAAIHVNLDFVGDAGAAWRLSNAMAPFLIATYANSPRYGGEDTGVRSFRSQQWRRLDPSRTGAFAPTGRPIGDYLEFALGARAFLMGDEGEDARPYGDWLGRGESDADWRRHLSTLFPEVRPRGYLEFRCIDSLPPRWYAAVVVPMVGVLYDAEASREARASLPDVTPAALEAAGRDGLADAGLARGARELFRLGLEGARRLGEGRVGGEALETAETFFRRFTARALDPGSGAGTVRTPTPAAATG